MKKLLGICFILFLSSQAITQQQIKVIGRVKNTYNQNLEAVLVMVFKAVDTSFVAETFTSQDGAFEFQLSPNKYMLICSSPGFSRYSQTIEVIEGNKFNMVDIVLNEELLMLKGATVTARIPIIEHKIDKSTFNVEGNILAGGSNIIDLLAQAPFVTVGQDGSITINNIQGALIMIDGKPTAVSGSDLSAMLRNMPAEQVSKIEVITSPSAKYDAAGSAGIINIKLKKNKRDGLNGIANLSLQQGRLPRINDGLQFNLRHKKLNIYGNLGHNRNERWNEEYSTLRIKSNFSGDRMFSITEKSFYLSNSINSRLGLDYCISPKTTLGILGNSFLGKERERSGNTNSVLEANSRNASLLMTRREGINKYNNFSINLNMNHVFDSLGKNISADLDFAQFNDLSQPEYITDFYGMNGEKWNSQFLNGDMNTKINMGTFKADYEHSLNDKSRFAIGVKHSMVKNNNRIVYLLNNKINKNRSNNFLYTESISAIYLDISKEQEKFSIKLGVRGEYTLSNGRQLALDSQFTRSYFQLFPTAFFQYIWNQNHSTGMTVNRRILRPDYESLNPFVYFSDPLNSWAGNPYLNPAISANIKLSHTFKNNFNIFMSYNNTMDVISPYQRMDSIGGGIFQTKSNLGQSNNFSLGASFNLEPTAWWRLNLNTVIFQNISKGDIGEVDTYIKLTSYRIFINNNFNLSSKTKADMSYWYRPSSLWGISKTGAMGSFSIGLQRKIFNDNATLKISINDIFKMQKMKTITNIENIQSTSLHISENRSIRLSISWNLGNRKLKSERERSRGVEEEAERVKARD